jgi:hypothetical protein
MIDQQKAKEAYESYLNKAKDDSRIIGVMLAGGRGKGAASENSDYDVIFVTTDDGFESVKKDYPKTEYIDSLPHAISEFREHAKIGTGTQYDKYTFTHTKAIIDKTGEVQKLIDEKGALDATDAQKIARSALGGYLNSLHRSLKNIRDKNILAGHLDATETIPELLTFIFAIEERVRPFNKFLVWELENYPLKKLPISTPDFIAKIQAISQNADSETQKELLQMVRKLAIENGHADEIADWEGYYFG